MGGQVSEVSAHDDPGPARGRQLERHQHPPHLAPARAALGGLLALREAAAPGALHAGAADRLAAAGRALRRQAGAGDDRRRRRDPARRRGSRCGRRGSRGCWGCGSSRPTRSPTWSGSASASRSTARTSQVDGPARPPLRRHPRGRPDRGGRPGPRLRRAPADDAAGGGRAGSAASAASSSCAAGPRTRLRDLGFDQVVGWSFTDPGEPARLRIPDGDPRADADPARQPALRGPVGDADDRCSARCSTSPPATSPATPTASPSSSPARSTCSCRRAESDEGPLAGRLRRPSGRRRSPSRTGSPALAVGPLVETAPGGAAASPPTSSRSRRVLEALAGQLGVELSFEAAPEPFLHPGRVGRGLDRRRPGRLDRRGPPAGLPGLGPRGRGRLRNRHGGAARRRHRRRGDLRGRHRPSPPPTRTLPSSSPAEVTAAAVRDAILAGGGELLRSAEVFDLYEGEQLGRGAQEPRPAARVPRRRPHPHRRGGRRRCGTRSRRSWSEIGGTLRE